MIEITSVKNSKVQFVKKLQDKSFRKREGLLVVEGENIVKDLPSSVEAENIFVVKDKVGEFDYILKRYAQDKIIAVDDKVMKSLSETVTPSGILAVVKANAQKKDIVGNVVILDGISDPGNFGTIIRTCVACDIKDIIAINCVDYTSGKVVRASMGGIFRVNITECDRNEALTMLSNHKLYALDMGGESIYELSKPIEPFALAVGSESKGLSAELRNNSQIVALPMKGDIESLNAGVSLSIALYRFVFEK
ncbi:MAG: RNA methyltransferase [Clostridiales bacterium]|nr:RNA methyltransferase [Clostridiales bacterium]